MSLTERLPGCKDLLSLCDGYPQRRPVSTEIPPVTLGPSWSRSSLQFPDRSKVRVRFGRPEGVHHFNRDRDRDPYPRRPSLSLRPISAGKSSRKRKDTFDREEIRKAKLENDPWSDKTRLTAKSVFCLGCRRDIKLDRRNDYYPGLWLKHRGLCRGIARARARARKSVAGISVDVEVGTSEGSEFDSPTSVMREESPSSEGSETDSPTSVKREESPSTSDTDLDSPMEPPMDDEQAARILVELMTKSRRFDDSDSGSSYSEV
ncbi:hypothetical protein L218DRAFT_502421 [Marasmius fiardii PR-910]|nr:hypothetical protein L218DRAFT_502421 [Marasmius fiardii PR-910]